MKSGFAAALLLLIMISGAPALENSALGISAAAKQKAKPKARPAAARAPQPFRWRPADPSFDQQGRLYRPPPGMLCPIDLGYGRWVSCHQDF
jgi:hypothetical protein